MTKLSRAVALIVFGLLTVNLSFAQNYPTKPIRVVVGFPAGGAYDVAARIVVQRMAPALGQSVLVENRPGGGTVVATEYVARQAGDGYTVLMVGPSFATLPALRSKLPFDTGKDFKAVAQVISLPVAFAVHPSLPVKTLQDLIALARARPGELAYGTAGPGTVHNLIGEMFKLATKVDIIHAPFQGGAPATTAAVGGHIMMLIVNVAEMASFVHMGRLRGIVVTTPERAEAMPDTPTIREAGYPQLEATNWSGFVIPAATPQAVIARLNAETVRALGMPEVRDSLRVQGMSPAPGTPEQFADLIRKDAARYAVVVRDAKMTVD
jgi:tripartite-type tricarboxylate transporter receptor subunit TctC